MLVITDPEMRQQLVPLRCNFKSVSEISKKPKLLRLSNSVQFFLSFIENLLMPNTRTIQHNLKKQQYGGLCYAFVITIFFAYDPY